MTDHAQRQHKSNNINDLQDPLSRQPILENKETKRLELDKELLAMKPLEPTDRSALQAIADMALCQTDDYRKLLALAIAIAQIQLEGGLKTNDEPKPESDL